MQQRDAVLERIVRAEQLLQEADAIARAAPCVPARSGCCACCASITSNRLVRIFEQLRRDQGLPQVLRTDNGPEFLGEAFVQWAKANGMAIQYIQPGKPNQNAYIERFNRTFRDEVLDQHLFARIDDVREAAWWWISSTTSSAPTTPSAT